jgi:bleomycin hydrolase
MKQLILLIGGFWGSFQAMAQPPSPAQLGLKLPPQTLCTEVKDQAVSATCWSFASNSFLESELKRLGRGHLDLSEMFVARYSYLRKIETHLRLKGGNFFTPGGQYHDVMWVLKNHGIMPESAYPGLENGNSYHHHAELDTAIKYYVATLLAKGVTQLQKQHYQYLDSVFNRHLGIVLDNFTFQNRNFTPRSFAKAILEDINPDDYIEITSYTHHPFYTRYVVEDKYNWTGDLYYNVPVQDFIAITQRALQKGFTVCWDGDVTETTFDFDKGLAWLPYKGRNWQQERQRTLEDSTSTIDHMMHITGMVKDKQGKNWYCVKNSWGSYGNPLGGYLFMSEAYFNIKTTAIVVHKDALPAATRKNMGL